MLYVIIRNHTIREYREDIEDLYKTNTTCVLPSLERASRMLRQAVARSAMDCHSSSVESVVSERTERKRLMLSMKHVILIL